VSGAGVDDRVAAEDERALYLVRIRHLVPRLETRVVVMRRVTFMAVENGNDQVLDGALDRVRRDVFLL
jgi:hypothetical protein